ncbi:MAG: hypothetical protein EOO61_13800 [Hymenobacter sp.]|nr:MAG: hypothetical protein EOO61_13800 [Hymenobacter sp.]
MPDTISKKYHLKDTAAVPKNFNFERLPKELQLEVVRNLMPEEAISLEAASHASRELLENNPQVWMQQGLKPPILVGQATLKQVWQSRVRTLDPRVQVWLSRLTRPVNVFSDIAVENFYSTLDQMDLLEDQAREPTVMAYMGPDHMNSIIRLDNILTEVEMRAKKIGVTPNIPADRMKEVCELALSRFLRDAVYAGKNGHIESMKQILTQLAFVAKKAEAEMPSLPLDDMSQKTKSAYFEIMNELKTETQN